MKLYYAPGACSLAVHMALREIGAKLATRFAELEALPLTQYPHLKTYLTRVSERPRVHGALRAGGLAK